MIPALRVLPRKLVPRSLAGQIACLLGIALLVAQLVNLALILNERQKLGLAQNEGPAITRFADMAGDLAAAGVEFHSALLHDSSHRGARFALAATSGIPAAARLPATEERLARALVQNGIAAAEVRAARETALPRRASARAGSTHADHHAMRMNMQVLRLAMRRPTGDWLIGQMMTPRRDPWFAARLVAATLLLYLIVLGPTIWLANRIARPLRNLTRAAESFGGRTDPAPVAAEGPADLRVAIQAFNAMNARVVGLIDEKDRMLGAIGHDLRTPLASLRIRIESIEADDERAAAVAKIEEMTAMLEDILVLARSGRAREEARAMDVAALAEAIVEEYADRGQPVRFVPTARAVADVQPILLRRALRNLIDNAVQYGGSADVTVEAGEDTIEVRVADSGPGIAPDQLDQVLQPFYRIEGSRNRATGGSGLGLAIARSVAESHGGTLRLAPAHPTGLIATLALTRRAADGSDGGMDEPRQTGGS
jgi:signal transduction histidine kinase